MIKALLRAGIDTYSTGYFRSISFPHGLVACINFTCVTPPPWLDHGIQLKILKLLVFFIVFWTTWSSHGVTPHAFLDLRNNTSFMLFLWKQESRKNIIEIIVFILLLLLFFLYTRDASLHAYDDFSHWGIFTKELLYFGVFENQSSLTSIITTHAHYPRGAAVYHYFMLLLSGYSDGNVLFTHFLLHLAFLAPLAANKQLWQTGMLFSLLLCGVVLYTTGIRSIYNDSTIVA